MEFIIRVECSDCTDIDIQGCFSGKSGYAVAAADSESGFRADEVGVDSATRFPTRESAEQAIDIMEQGEFWPSVWHCEVITLQTVEGAGRE